MKISKVKISNFMGIEELEFDAGQFNVMSGQNGHGKTSILEAVKSVFSGGHDATLLRNGADKGEVVLVLDDGQEIARRIKADASSTVVRRDGKQITRPAETIRELTDLLSVNPVDFLRAPKKDRVRALLEAMPLQVDECKLRTMSGIDLGAIRNDAHALQVIDEISRRVYDERTGTNRAVKEKESTINQLRGALPAAPAGIDGGEDELQARLDTENNALDAERQRIATKLGELQAAHEARMDELRQQMDAEKAAFEEIKSKTGLQRQKAADRHAAATGPVRDALTAIRANRDAAAKRQQSLVIIEQMDDEAQKLRETADRQSRALAGIEAYKQELLANLPIAGLEIRDGDLYRDGVHFDRLNTAQQVQIAVDLAVIRAGELGVICVDGIELLDTESYEAFRDSAVASGLQMFVTRVADGDLSINAE